VRDRLGDRRRTALLAIVLLTLTGFHDLFDGAVAKASKRASQRGNFFDSVMDRVADAIILGGVAFYLTATTTVSWSCCPSRS
jgi:phosphatidylglycerophosphate synthase